MLNVLSVYVCVQLNCVLGGQFVSWAAHVSFDSRAPPHTPATLPTLRTVLDKDISWALLTLHAHS